MEKMFIPAKSRAKVNKTKILSLSNKLPKNIALVFSIQFQDIALEIRKILSENHKITAFMQVLGCSQPRFQDTDAILLIGSGKFHAVSLAFETKLPVFVLKHEELEKVSDKDVQELETKHKTSYLKFLHADKVGILITTKPGQERIKRSLELKKKLNKKTYLFIGNNIDIKEFENFTIDSWINTACPRMDFDRAIINLNDLNLK
ncbi:MAG: diphthamide synthesis protein [Nanoarchaeota archaeon]|nr:diphthamide synthesis protein [Nanoarchaeota archaeon]